MCAMLARPLLASVHALLANIASPHSSRTLLLSHILVDEHQHTQHRITVCRDAIQLHSLLLLSHSTTYHHKRRAVRVVWRAELSHL